MAEQPESQAITGHREIAASLDRWFVEHARDLPWRAEDPASGRRDAYRSLVSEIMLQQTQVSRVLEKFGPFLERFPTVEDLAAADEQDVLAAWSGLGYYRRARLLHSAAKDIASTHGGQVPSDADELQRITGIGRYTAGAIASIVFDQPVPIVDGNVSRVLMRLRGDDRAVADRSVVKKNWSDAETIAEAAVSPARTNEGLMELGALVCTPKAPRCELCPIRSHCQVYKRGLQDQIPAPKRAAKRSVVHHTAVLVRDETGRLLIERRAEQGLWASMWQAPTAESELASPRPSAVLRRLGIVGKVRKRAEFVHITSHREVRFRVYAITPAMQATEIERLAMEAGRSLISLNVIGDYPLANPHRRILEDGA